MGEQTIWTHLQCSSLEKLREQWRLDWVVLEMLPAVLVSRELREQWRLD